MDNKYTALWQFSYHYQLPAYRLLRPILVFWRFRTVFRKIAFLMTIIALFVTSIVLLLLTLNNIVCYGRNKVFWVLLLLKILFFLILTGGFFGLLMWGKAGIFSLTGFEFLGLNSSDLDFLAIESWVCILAKVFWDRQWLLW